MARGGTASPHVGYFLFTSHHAFVEGQRIRFVLAGDDFHYYSLMLLAEMEEHANSDTRRKRPEVELPALTLVVSYSAPSVDLR